jgi:negative regulator of genetic competence, sporulation and motility
MFVTQILNSQLNLRKIISLEHPMKPERLVDEVFSYGNIYYLHVEIIRRRRHRRRQKIYAKIGEIL